MASRQKDEEKRPPVSEVVTKLREIEDYNLALSLQEEEFGNHYDANRKERRIMGVDTRKSKEEQLMEARLAMEKRMREAEEIAKRDEELALQLARELEAEEERRRLEQARIDEELAKSLQLNESPVRPERNGHHDLSEDERIARELQERYLRRVSRPNRRLDEEVQNQLNTLVATNTLPSPNSPRLPPLPSYHEAINQRHSIPSPVQTSAGTYFPVADPVSTPALVPERNGQRVHFAQEEVPARPQTLGFDIASPQPTTVQLPVLQPSTVQLPPVTTITNTISFEQVSNGHVQPLIVDLGRQGSASSDLLPTPPPEALTGLHPTNPFLQDLLRAQNGQVNGNNVNGIQQQAGSSNGYLGSEFGLPPPSSLANGNVTTNSNGIEAGPSSIQKKLPASAVKLLPDSTELTQRLPKRASTD